MAKSIMISIQIDEVTAKDLVVVEEVIEEALKPFKRKRVILSLNDLMGPPIPVSEE